MDMHGEAWPINFASIRSIWQDSNNNNCNNNNNDVDRNKSHRNGNNSKKSGTNKTNNNNNHRSNNNGNSGGHNNNNNNNNSNNNKKSSNGSTSSSSSGLSIGDNISVGSESNASSRNNSVGARNSTLTHPWRMTLGMPGPWSHVMTNPVDSDQLSDDVFANGYEIGPPDGPGAGSTAAASAAPGGLYSMSPEVIRTDSPPPPLLPPPAPPSLLPSTGRQTGNPWTTDPTFLHGIPWSRESGSIGDAGCGDEGGLYVTQQDTTTTTRRSPTTGYSHWETITGGSFGDGRPHRPTMTQQQRHEYVLNDLLERDRKQQEQLDWITRAVNMLLEKSGARPNGEQLWDSSPRQRRAAESLSRTPGALTVGTPPPFLGHPSDNGGGTGGYGGSVHTMSGRPRSILSSIGRSPYNTDPARDDDWPSRFVLPSSGPFDAALPHPPSSAYSAMASTMMYSHQYGGPSAGGPLPPMAGAGAGPGATAAAAAMPSYDEALMAIEKEAKTRRSFADRSEASLSWEGTLALRTQAAPTYATKVFVGGLPYDVKPKMLGEIFGKFGLVSVQSPPQGKGHAYLVLDNERQVHALLAECDKQNPEGYYYYRVSSHRKERKTQIIPWAIEDSEWIAMTDAATAATGPVATSTASLADSPLAPSAAPVASTESAAANGEDTSPASASGADDSSSNEKNADSSKQPAVLSTSPVAGSEGVQQQQQHQQQHQQQQHSTAFWRKGASDTAGRRLNTVFVGALHGEITAEGLQEILSNLFGPVLYVAIDTDKYRYPSGSARVTFASNESFRKAVAAEFVHVMTPRFAKTIQLDAYIEDGICSDCRRSTPIFCRHPNCFSYYCAICFERHRRGVRDYHPPVMRNRTSPATTSSSGTGSVSSASSSELCSPASSSPPSPLSGPLSPTSFPLPPLQPSLPADGAPKESSTHENNNAATIDKSSEANQHREAAREGPKADHHQPTSAVADAATDKPASLK